MENCFFGLQYSSSAAWWDHRHQFPRGEGILADFSIVTAVEKGRIQKCVAFIMSVHIAAVMQIPRLVPSGGTWAW